MSAGAVPVTRGCGRRTSGAAYWECGMSPDGRPIEEFLIDAPTLIPPGLAVAPRGVSLITVGGVTHVVDWIGAAHYPNVLDFVAEVARFGLSRRLPSSLDFARLTPASRILLVHARARVENASVYGPFACPKNLHAPGSDACIGGSGPRGARHAMRPASSPPSRPAGWPWLKGGMRRRWSPCSRAACPWRTSTSRAESEKGERTPWSHAQHR